LFEFSGLSKGLQRSRVGIGRSRVQVKGV